jgi:hypothetical protein
LEKEWMKEWGRRKSEERKWWIDRLSQGDRRRSSAETTFNISPFKNWSYLMRSGLTEVDDKLATFFPLKPLRL